MVMMMNRSMITEPVLLLLLLRQSGMLCQGGLLLRYLGLKAATRDGLDERAHGCSDSDHIRIVALNLVPGRQKCVESLYEYRTSNKELRNSRYNAGSVNADEGGEGRCQ